MKKTTSFSRFFAVILAAVTTVVMLFAVCMQPASAAQNPYQDGTYRTPALLDSGNGRMISIADQDGGKVTAVINGESMTVTIRLGGSGAYTYLYQGTAADAPDPETTEAGLIPQKVEVADKKTGEEVYRYTLKMKTSDLDQEVNFAAYSKNRKKWYDHTLTVRSANIAVKTGTCFTSGKITYQVTSASKKTVKVQKASAALTSASVKDTVSYKGTKYKVTAVSSRAFAGNKKLTSVTLGKNVTTIGKAAFQNDKKLSKVAFKGTKVTKIGAKSFQGIAKKAVFKTPKSVYKKYVKMIRKAGAPKSAVYKK